ncbi:MAG: hypothetical protein U0529_08005 [Thermoanaerobaculia bacterium]
MSTAHRESPEAHGADVAGAPPPGGGLAHAHAAVLRALLYYRIFRFPLRGDEVERLSGHAFAGPGEAARVLSDLVDRGLAGESDGLYFVGDASQASERREAERCASGALPRALRRSRLIARFPFVRGVALTGTISKGVFRDGDDVDFFVVTAKGRVWICRTLLMLFKKVVLLDSHRLFCVNYLVAEDALSIPDRNAFTATEVAWLKPVEGGAAFEAFFRENPWVSGFLPAWRPDGPLPPPVPSGPVKRLVERLLSGPRGDRLDDRLREAISRRNRRRYAHLAETAFEVALRAEKGSSKHHPNHFQERVLARHAEEIREFEARHGVRLGEAADA